MTTGLEEGVIGVGSFVLLVVASWCIGEGGEILGHHYDASIIGGLVIAWLNTAPETIFFITALRSGNPRFAVGAVSGSTIVVTTIALGFCVWIGASSHKSGSVYLQPEVRRQSLVLAASTLLTALVVAIGFSTILGWTCILVYLAFVIHSVLHKKAAPTEGKSEEDPNEVDDEEEDHRPVWKGVAYLVVGGALIFGFSEYFIHAVVSAATTLKVNPILLAFFLAPIASEAPEILESIQLSRKGKMQSINIAFSNLVGGTIAKTTLLCGVFALMGDQQGFVWESPNYTVSLTLLAVCAASAGGLGFFFLSHPRWHGALMFALFCATGLIQYFVSVFYDQPPQLID